MGPTLTPLTLDEQSWVTQSELDITGLQCRPSHQETCRVLRASATSESARVEATDTEHEVRGSVCVCLDHADKLDYSNLGFELKYGWSQHNPSIHYMISALVAYTLNIISSVRTGSHLCTERHFTANACPVIACSHVASYTVLPNISMSCDLTLKSCGNSISHLI